MSKVHNPAHYGGADNPFEAIKIIEDWGLGFCLGNALKYLIRAGRKSEDPREDLDKSLWYLRRTYTNSEKASNATWKLSIEDVSKALNFDPARKEVLFSIYYASMGDRRSLSRGISVLSFKEPALDYTEINPSVEPIEPEPTIVNAIKPDIDDWWQESKHQTDLLTRIMLVLQEIDSHVLRCFLATLERVGK